MLGAPLAHLPAGRGTGAAAGSGAGTGAARAWPAPLLAVVAAGKRPCGACNGARAGRPPARGCRAARTAADAASGTVMASAPCEAALLQALLPAGGAPPAVAVAVGVAGARGAAGEGCFWPLPPAEAVAALKPAGSSAWLSPPVAAGQPFWAAEAASWCCWPSPHRAKLAGGAHSRAPGFSDIRAGSVRDWWSRQLACGCRGAWPGLLERLAGKPIYIYPRPATSAATTTAATKEKDLAF